MNIMNRYFFLSICCWFISITGFAQAFREGYQLQLYPLTGSQIENYNGDSRLLNFSETPGNFVDELFSPLVYNGTVKAMDIKEYSLVMKWDEPTWEQSNSYTINIIDGNLNINGRFLFVGQIPMWKCCTPLGVKGENTKRLSNNMMATYNRDERGRVQRINITDNYKRIIYIYNYAYLSDSDSITKIEAFDSNGTRLVEIEYQYNDDKLLVAASGKNYSRTFVPKTCYTFSYDNRDNVSQITWVRESESSYDRIASTYQFTYSYSSGQISSCTCVHSGETTNWTFKYDDPLGNWTELIKTVNVAKSTYKTKMTRKITYK